MLQRPRLLTRLDALNPAARAEEKRRLERIRSRRYRKSQRDGVEIVPVKINQQRHEKLERWLRLKGDSAEVRRSNAGTIIGDVLDALDLPLRR